MDTKVLASRFLFISLVTIVAAEGAYAGNGKGGGKPSGDPPPSVGCTGNFPALAYIELRRRKSGRVIGRDLVLTNATADADCRVVVYSGEDQRYEYVY